MELLAVDVAHKRAPCDFSRVAAPTLKATVIIWAGGRAVERTGLENRRTLTGLVGSNPTLPAFGNGRSGHAGGEGHAVGDALNNSHSHRDGGGRTPSHRRDQQSVWRCAAERERG